MSFFLFIYHLCFLCSLHPLLLYSLSPFWLGLGYPIRSHEFCSPYCELGSSGAVPKTFNQLSTFYLKIEQIDRFLVNLTIRFIMLSRFVGIMAWYQGLEYTLSLLFKIKVSQFVLIYTGSTTFNTLSNLALLSLSRGTRGTD